MIKSGIASVTFRELSPERIISLVSGAGLSAIEWGGDVHVPHGNLGAARDTGRRTRDAGLEVASFGSYYRAGESEAGGLAFASVLETAVALEAPLIRVWAGARSPKDADTQYREMVSSDTRRLAGQAADAGIRIAYEYHSNTLTETHASAIALLDAVGSSNVSTYWQVPFNVSAQERAESLRTILPHLAHVHVFHWTSADSTPQRRPLAEGKIEWLRDLRVIHNTGQAHYALLEFVQGNTPTSFSRDAAVLRDWIACVSARRG
ncbi:MAG: sugar phosphate isomerase/epimerase [Sedimentisphaerales bacterium]|nr:sugar phosphate isomerase/epimerase [Sedimentisphaerales bacterium]